MRRKMMCLMAAVVPISVVCGCAGTVHTLFIHVSELAQLAAALGMDLGATP